ncbi:MAG: hypothetical protein KDH09_02290 [Chrysiogenetes bacterium]|nr:hypothetical protein [Chrysiogenetes bacterium]
MSDISNPFIENLKIFNRKERYHLLRFVMGGPFTLGDEFRKKLKVTLDGLEIPDGVDFIAMDYHLDWLAACAALGKRRATREDTTFPNRQLIDAGKDYWISDTNQRKGVRQISGNQEDVDLLIAYRDPKDGELVHLIFCEAKGDTGWTRKQIVSKIERLKAIFNRSKMHLELHFVLVGPNPKSKIASFEKYEGHFEEKIHWPDWASNTERTGIPFIQMSIDFPLRKPTRIDNGKGHYTDWALETVTSFQAGAENEAEPD